jgi:hypothetical protein
MRNLSLLLLCAGAVLLGGCAQQPLAEGAKVARRVDDRIAPDARIQYDQVVILDRSLQNDRAGKLAVERQGARRNPTGTVKVIAQFRNRTDFNQAIEARVSFFDNEFVPVEKPSAWSRIILSPNGTGTYEESSTMTSDVAHYLVEVREAR